MRKRCRICHVMADIDENGRCSFCNDVYMASQSNMTYGKYMMQKDTVSVTAAQHGSGERQCAYCKDWFVPNRSFQIYCSEKCRKKGRRRT